MRSHPGSRFACAIAAVCGLLLIGPRAEVSGASTVFGLTIPDEHPRLWWNAERLARGKAWWDRNRYSPRSDDPLGHATACVLGQDRNACRTAVDYAMGVICTNAACTNPNPEVGVASDIARWEGENVILIYDWCYDHFSPEQRQTLITRWNGYLKNLQARSWGGPRMVQSNYNWGYMRNEIEWGIATWGENPEAEANLRFALVDRWETNLIPHFNGTGRGGVFQEGSAYGGALGMYSTVPFGSAALLGRDMYRETNFFREAVMYVIYATLPDRTYNRNNKDTHFELFPFADDERFFDGGMPERDTYGSFMLAMADYWRDVPIGQYARRWVKMVNPIQPAHIRAIDRGGLDRDFSTLPLDYFAPGARFFYTRTQWGPQATSVNLQLAVTNDEGHQHNDVGSWQLWRNGRWLSRETTGYSQTIAGYGGGGVDTNNFAAHNSLLIAGVGPARGYHSGQTVVRRVDSAPEFSYAAVNLTPAYRATHPVIDNPAVGSVEREFLFVRPLETLVIFDRLESTTTSTKTFLAHFETSPTVDSAGGIVTAVNGGQALRVATLLPSSPSYRPVVNEGGAVGQFRLEVESAPSHQTYFLNVLQAKAASDPDLISRVEDGGTFFRLTLSHPTKGVTTVTFQKGMTAAGTALTTAGGSFALTGATAEIAVTDEGAVWQR